MGSFRFFFEAAVSDASQGQELGGRWKFDGNGGAGGEGSGEWIERGATAGRLRHSRLPGRDVS